MALARRYFPLEAELAMQVAEAGLTTEFTGLLASEDSDGNFGEAYFSETTSEVFEKRQQRLLALQRTGKFFHLPIFSTLRFKPYCFLH